MSQLELCSCKLYFKAKPSNSVPFYLISLQYEKKSDKTPGKKKTVDLHKISFTLDGTTASCSLMTFKIIESFSYWSVVKL